jgi:uncharacterized membrane protein
MHPFLVHFPIALLPLAVGADFVGLTRKNVPLVSFGQKAIAVGAVGAVAAVVSGLIAGEEVLNAEEGRSRDMLQTHRTLNVLAMITMGCMAVWRVKHKWPNATYLGVGGVAIGVIGYTGYLGGKLVSKFGVGVGPAGGVYQPDAPAFGAGRSVTAFIKAAGVDLAHGVRHMIQEVRSGQIIPTLVSKPPRHIADAPETVPSES